MRIKNNWVLVTLILESFSLLISINAYSQKFEISLGAGFHKSHPSFHYSSAIDNEDVFDGEGSNFKINITSPLANEKFFLTTEIGFIKSVDFLSISYDYDEGFGLKHKLILQHLSDYRFYFSLLPKYRLANNALILDVYAGPLISSGFHSGELGNETSVGVNNPFGVKFGVSLRKHFRHFGIYFDANIATLGRRSLINRFQPSISYTLRMYEFGIAYKL